MLLRMLLTCILKKENILRVKIVWLRHTYQNLSLIMEKSNSFQLKATAFVKLCYELIWMTFPIYLHQWQKYHLKETTICYIIINANRITGKHKNSSRGTTSKTGGRDFTINLWSQENKMYFRFDHWK